MLPFELTKDTPYLALSGELWSVFYEYFNRNWPCYKGFLLYIHCITWRFCLVHASIGLTFKTAFYDESDFIYFKIDSEYYGDRILR